MSDRNLYATLIGINAYESANSLDGCIKDVLNFDRILRRLCRRQEGHLEGLIYNPLYLLAPHESDLEVIRNYQKSEGVDFGLEKPTFDNVSGKAFSHLGQAKDKDICVLYYSGHGSYIDAPEEFWDTKSSHQNETLVCVDSRSTARDLVDKELAYLLYKTLDEKPEVHCLIIMDCCHSGDNVRSVNKKSQPVKYRQETPSNQKLSIKNYIGYREGFFEKENFRIANYVHLAACRDNEKAQDGFNGGLFSRKLAELLNANGENKSYRQLAQSLASTISIQNGQQNPVVYAFDDAHLDKPFLGDGLVPYEPNYEVRYLAGAGIWQLQAGSLQGIAPSGASQMTTVKILPSDIEAEVTAVNDFTATLKGEALQSLDQRSNQYVGVITSLAMEKQVIGVSEKLKNNEPLLSRLSEAFKESKYIYFDLDINSERKADYMVDTFKNGGTDLYYLTQTHNDIPVFKAENDVDSFLKNVDAVCKWVYVKNLQSGESVFTEKDFIFSIDIIEGQEITVDNVETITGRRSEVKPGGQIDLSYKDNHKPILRFSVEINPASNLEECYIQSLYLDSLFGISGAFSGAGTNHLVKGAKFHLKTVQGQRSYNLVRFKLDDDYASYNINEILEQLKIIVSKKPKIDLEAYQQKSLELGANKRNVLTKSADFELLGSDSRSQWAVFNFGIRIIGPKKDIRLTPGAVTDFSSFSIKVPEGFNAIATAITTADTGIGTRSAHTVSPSIWGNALSESRPFGDEFGAMAGHSVVALEIGVPDGESMPILREGTELIIEPKTSSAVTRSVDGFEATTIPYGYDEETQLYYPIGYQDRDGNIHINNLPKPTPGSIVPGTITTRSITGSIKMYFKKLLRKPTNFLTLHAFKDGKWSATKDTETIGAALKTVKAGQILPLVIHGIIGDTEGIMEGLQEDPTLPDRLPVILSYDYENLNTTVPVTARMLKVELEKLGIGKNDIPKLTLIAHSMGGLVSRWLIEQEGGATFVDKLVMAGTPNGGSEWSKAGGYILNGAGMLLIHALNVTGPLKYAVTGLSFFINKLHDPQAALKGMGLDSELIKDLAASARPAGVAYYLLGSDTAMLRNYGGNDKFLTKIKNALMDKVVFPGLDLALFKQPNDMAVTLKSMKTIPGFQPEISMQTLAGDHISYFTEPDIRRAILDKVTG